MNRQTKVSLLKKERELLYQILPKDTKGKAELKVICDCTSDWIIAGINSYDNGNFKTSKHRLSSSKEIQTYLKTLLQIEAKEEDIEKVRSDKKRLLITKGSYKQRF